MGMLTIHHALEELMVSTMAAYFLCVGGVDAVLVRRAARYSDAASRRLADRSNPGPAGRARVCAMTDTLHQSPWRRPGAATNGGFAATSGLNSLRLSPIQFPSGLQHSSTASKNNPR